MRYITDFKQTIKKSDIEEAKTILDKFPGETDETKFELINELALAPDDTAWELLLYLALEIKIYDKNIYQHIIQLIMDRAHLNFKFALILYKTGDIKTIKGGVPLMRHILSNSTDQYILSKTIETAGKEKIEALVDDIAEYIYYDDAELKGTAVKALGSISSQIAIHRLEQACTTIKCDNNILDTLELLGVGKQSTGEKIILSLYEELKSISLDTRFKAFGSIVKMSEADHRQIISKNFKSDNHDLKINTLRFISRTIPEIFLPDIYALLDTKQLDPKIKFTALETLYAFPELDSAAALINCIEDPAMYVSMAAAKILDKNSTDFVCAEIKDRIESGKRRRENIVHAIIDAKAENIINFLMVSDTFSDIAHNYLSRTASDSCLKKYIEILSKRGLKSTAKKFQEMIIEKTSDIRPVAAVVSSSSCVQDVYEKLLFSRGYTYIGYKSCQDAFEAISHFKPALVICDLFLNEMTGIAFAREIREFYLQDKLPFIISSRQRDFIGGALAKECKNAGINAVMEFPAKIPAQNSMTYVR